MGKGHLSTMNRDKLPAKQPHDKSADTDKIGLIIFWVITAIVVSVSGFFVIKALVSDGSSSAGDAATVDYTEEAFETALNAGENTIGKTVKFTVQDVKPDSACGHNLQSGVHLNFCSTKDPGANTGDELTVKVTEVNTLLGSYLINYEIVK